ncbi:hypothetical protein Hdeb2414_s0011g00362461 [Helianthus debilis subsp. tardiflorus]
MENNTPSSSAPPFSAGTGGKFRKPPVSRNRPSTPYDRPSLPTASYKSNDDDGGGWLSKLVVTPARRFIASSATRILPALFSKSEPSVADEYDYDSSDDEDVDETVNALGDAEPTLELVVASPSRDTCPSNERDKLKGISDNANIQLDKSSGDIDQIVNMLKGKQLTLDESNRLMEILKSKLVDDSNAELDHQIPSMGKQYDVETPVPHLQSNIQDEVAASPIDLAKAYMGSQASELGFNTHSNVSASRREHAHNNLFPSKPRFFTPSSKSSTCLPGAMVQDHRAYLTPQTQRSRHGLHSFPRTPYSRTKPKLNQLQGNTRSSNTSLTTLQQSRTPNPGQMKISSDVTDGGYGSVGPIRRIRNKFASEPHSEGPRTFSSAQIASSSNASRSFVPVFQKKSLTAATPNLHTVDKHEQAFKNDANFAGPSNETVRKILDQLDRHKPTPKEKAAELKLATEWKRSPSQHSNSIMPNFKTSNEALKTLTPVNDAGAGTSFGFKNMGVTNEKSTATNFNEKEKSQPWSFGNQINGQDLSRKRPSQPILKPISFKRPDPQHVVSSDNGPGFTFPFTANASSTSEPLTPSIMPSFPPTAAAPQSNEMHVIPTYSFGTKNSGERVVFSFPSTSSAPVDDGASNLKFNFGSDKKRVSFGSIGSDAIVR